LLDVDAAIEAIETYLERGSLHDGLIYDACRMRLLEIGEAVKGIDSEVLDQEPEITWNQIARMRDILAHRYHDTDFAVVTAVIEERLPELRVAIKRLLAVIPE